MDVLSPLKHGLCRTRKHFLCRLPDGSNFLVGQQSRPRRQAHGDPTCSVRWFCGHHQPRGCVHPRTIGGPHRGPAKKKSKSSKKKTVVVKKYSSSVKIAQTKSLIRRPCRCEGPSHTQWDPLPRQTRDPPAPTGLCGRSGHHSRLVFSPRIARSEPKPRPGVGVAG